MDVFSTRGASFGGVPTKTNVDVMVTFANVLQDHFITVTA